MPVSSVTEHWIKQDAVTINLNHFGDPDYLQVSVLAGAVVMAFKQDVIGYNAAHNYRTWPLQAANTYLENTFAVNVYARLTRSEVNASALIIYDPVLRDIEGRAISYSEDGSEMLGEADTVYFYMFLGQISKSINSNGEQIAREWEISFRLGSLDTSQYRNEEVGGEWQKMFRLNKVTDMIDVLKTFSSAVFKKLFVGEKEINNVQRSSDEGITPRIDDTTIPTTKFLEGRYLSKQKDDKTPFNLGVGQNLTVDKNVIAGEDIIVGKSAHSTDFVSGFVGGKGWAIRLKEWINAAGEKEIKSVGEFDEVIVRNLLRVYEFIISQLLGENDNRILTGMMEVDHYDASDGKIYLKTNGGKLYNPFRVDDVIIVQQYGGNPSEENGYYVTKQYEFIVTEVGIGEMGEDRLDWVRFRNFTTSMEGGNESLISERDTLVRIDNLSDASRKGVIQLMSVGEDTPYMDFIYGAKTDPENSLKGRFGNIGGIYNPLFGWLKEFGAYLTNLYAVGEFRIAHTGEDIADAIEILKGTFRTNFSQTSYDITEEADFFTNATFTNDCEYWELSEEDTSYFAVGDVPQFFNYELYASENSFAGLSEYDGRSALRLTNGYAKQLNEYIRKPSTHTEYSGVNDSLEKVGEDVVDTLYLSVRVYAATDSIIELGFTDSNGSFIENDFHHNESLEASKDGYTINLSGKWDGNGDFTIKGTGDVYIDHLSLTDKPLENFRITTFTAIEQTAQSIKLLGTRIDGATGAITQVQQSVNALNGTISSIASTVNGHTTSISNLTISVNGINSTVSTKVGKSEIISSINQSSESVTINANKINLNGTVTANKTFKIDTSGYMTCVGGTIGGFTIKEKRLMASSKVNMILNAGENDDYPSIGWFGSASAAYASLGVVTSGGFLGGQLYLSNTNQESTLFSPSGLSINGTNNTILLSASVTNSSGIPYPAIDITSKKNLSAHVVIGFRGSRISFYSQNWPTTSADVGIGEVYLDGTTLRVRTS